MVVEFFPIVAALLAPFPALSAIKTAPRDCEYTVPATCRQPRVPRMEA